MWNLIHVTSWYSCLFKLKCSWLDDDQFQSFASFSIHHIYNIHMLYALLMWQKILNKSNLTHCPLGTYLSELCHHIILWLHVFWRYLLPLLPGEIMKMKPAALFLLLLIIIFILLHKSNHRHIWGYGNGHTAKHSILKIRYNTVIFKYQVKQNQH
jgi:hypothetical protein